MEQRHLGLAMPTADSSYTEAASVRPDRHQFPTEFDLDRSGSRSASTVDWLPPNSRARGVLHAIHPDRDWPRLADEETLTLRVVAVGEEVGEVLGAFVNTAVVLYAMTVAARHPFSDIEPETPRP